MSDDPKYPSQLAERFQIRMPDGLRDELRAAADANNRSMNAEIIARLESAAFAAKLIEDHARAEEKLFEQVKLERELRQQIEMLQDQVALLKEGTAGGEIDLKSSVVQDAMLQHLHAVMGGVVEDMREEHRVANGMPLLLKWFDQNPHERAEYDALSDDEQDEFVREKTHELWIEHLNKKRADRSGRPSRKAIVQRPADGDKPASMRKRRLDDK